MSARTLIGLAGSVAIAFAVGTVLPQTAHAESSPAGLAMGFSHTCAARADGNLWCWGGNESGQLGVGTVQPSLSPKFVNGFALGSAQVAAGDLFTCAVKTDHSLWCWGNNVSGQLGDGSINDSLVPNFVAPLGTGVAEVSTGELFACARKTDGTLWCWGGGFVGDGAGHQTSNPTQVTSLGTSVAQVSTGDALICARKTDGTLWCWGDNEWGAVGDGTTVDRLAPVQVTTLGSTVAEVSAGDLFACARKTDGTVWCWGTNDSGQLGDGTTADHFTPAQVTSLGATVAEISANGRHACARKFDGSLWCWGSNAGGELGDNTVVDRPTPVRVTAMGNVAAEVSTGMNHGTCARKTDGTIWCWGINAVGEVGDGTSSPRKVPVQVIFPPPPSPVPATNAFGAAALALLLFGAAGLALGRRRTRSHA